MHILYIYLKTDLVLTTEAFDLTRNKYSKSTTIAEKHMKQQI